MEYVLSACTVALGHGQYAWHHNLVLKELAMVADVQRMKVNKSGKIKPEMKCFLKAMQREPSKKCPASIPSFLDRARDWEIMVDLQGQGEYTKAIGVFSLWPDIVLFFQSMKQIALLELTVTWE